MTRSRGVLVVLVLVAAAAAATLAWRFRPRSGANRLSVRTIVLVTLDTFRADRMEAWGGKAGLTPTLDRLAREGVVFDRCLTTAPITLPAHASILTGTDPPYHGARINGAFRVSADSPFLAETLKERGFRTGAFVSAFVLDRRFGLDPGFEVYDGPHAARGPEPERLGEKTVDAALAFTASCGEDPAFAWVHLYDAHAPYLPPAEFRGKHPAAYDDEIAYVDACVARLLEGLSRQHRLDDALIAVVADHGEGLGEHDEMTHTVFVYDATLKVPLVLWSPGRFPAGRRLPGTWSVTALAPTMLDLLGVDKPAAMYGRSGADEVRANAALPVAGAPTDEHLAYFESEAPAYYYGFAPLVGAELGGLKLIVAPRPELYLPAADSAEAVNRIEMDKGAADELKRRLDEHLRRHDRKLRTAQKLTSAQQAVLSQLGYVSPSARHDGRDPKDGARIVKDIQDAQLTIEADPKRAIATLEALLQKEPNVAEAWELLGDAYMFERDAPNAARGFANAIVDRSSDPELRLKLGAALVNGGRPEDGEKWIRTALEVDATCVKAMVALGRLCLDQNRVPDALAQFHRAVSENPDDPVAHGLLSTSLERAQNFRAALAEIETAARLDPTEPEFAWAAARLHARLDQPEPQREQLRRYLTLAPQGEHAAEARAVLAAGN